MTPEIAYRDRPGAGRASCSRTRSPSGATCASPARPRRRPDRRHPRPGRRRVRHRPGLDRRALLRGRQVRLPGRGHDHRLAQSRREYNGFKICREEARALSLDDGIGEIRDLVVSGDLPPTAGSGAATLHRARRPRRLRRPRAQPDRSPTSDPPAQDRDRRRQRHGRRDRAPRLRSTCPARSSRSTSSWTAPSRTTRPTRSSRKTSATCSARSSSRAATWASPSTATPTAMFLIDEHGAVRRRRHGHRDGRVADAPAAPRRGDRLQPDLLPQVPETIAATAAARSAPASATPSSRRLMREEDAIFGGEHSGHFYFRDNWYADSRHARC